MTAVTERGTSGGTVVGIDVSETRLDTSAGGGQVHTFASAGEGTAALLEWLAAQRVALVVCELTGGYKKPLVRSLRQGEPALHLAHPNKMRAFALRSGRMAKTGLPDALPLRAGVCPRPSTPAGT